MTESAFRTEYRESYIAAFEADTSTLRAVCVQDATIRAQTAVFLVAGSNSAVASTRGINGQIAFGVVDNTQLSCTLVEKHGGFETTDFNIFASQGNQKKIMQDASRAVLSRDIDDTIVVQLDTATQDTATAREADMDLVEMCLTILGNNDVPIDDEDNIFAVITPAFRSFIRQTPEYTKGSYQDVKMLSGAIKKVWRAAGVNWITNTRLTGKGTSTEKCYFLHKNSMGHAANSKDMEVDVGYERKHKNSWTNASLYHNAKLLQNSGIVQALHDGSRYVAS